ncbi:MAG TPA: hypothetical protein VM935_00315 [Chitinophagaceae bacterium]|nr:hypothetical protein [Chitinophagaceae bacterium]
MRKVYTEGEFYDESILCDRCGWEGSGHDVNIVDLYGLAKLKEIHCPSCDTHLAGIAKAVRKRSPADMDQFIHDSLGNQFG